MNGLIGRVKVMRVILALTAVLRFVRANKKIALSFGTKERFLS
jgi:hypothetical protein